MTPTRFAFPALFLAALAAAVPASAPVEAEQPLFHLPGSMLAPPLFAEREVFTLLGRLDSTVARTPAPGRDELEQTMWNVAKQLQAGRMTPAAEAAVIARYREISQSRPEYAELAGPPLDLLRTMAVGRIPPPIEGRDLDGKPLSLASLRGRVVVVTFSADWCAICRTQYPYFRLMQELYRNWPLSIVSVETGASRDAARRVKTAERLTFASFWDPPTAENRDGAIAGAWRVRGWPSLFVLDGNGVIQFVDVREEDLLKAVKQVLWDLVDLDKDVKTVKDVKQESRFTSFLFPSRPSRPY
jgi:thiol-disulfide isomerase/thioredoxin